MRLRSQLGIIGLLGLAIAGLWIVGKGSGEDKHIWFADMTDPVGLKFVHDPGDLSKYWQAQIHGSGVALFDFDCDGDLDIYCLNFGGPDSASINRLYRNVDGKFEDVTASSGLGINGFSTGVAIGDVNNDGWPDVLVTQYCAVKLFLNNANGTFTDATEGSGLRNPLWGTSASFVDYDRDGWLDLVIVNYLEDDPNWRCYNRMHKRDYCGPTHFSGTVSKLFRGLGPKEKSPDNDRGAAKVHFQDVTVEAGLAKAGPGLGVYCADFSGDGWADILVVNDNHPNYLWINNQRGKFTDDALQRGIAVNSMGVAEAGMGVAVGDVDGDGRFDVYITHLSRERNTLWTQGTGRGEFMDTTAQAGLLASEWRGTGFGTLMADFDNDGWIDIAVANGGVEQGTPTPNPALGSHLMHYSERNQLFRNLGDGTFADVSAVNRAFCGTPNIARALASGDLNGDGALDLVVTNVGGRAQVFWNVAPQRGHWLVVRAVDPRLKRDAFGAEVRVRAGKRSWLRIINPSDSFQSCSDARAHFGLGQVAEYDSIHVLWPDGLAEVFPGGAADRIVPLRRGEGKEDAKSK